MFPFSLAALAQSLENRGNSPIFVRIAELLSGEIQGGRLRPGDRLPGTRPLAEQLGVGRNTVLAAYGELAAEGWIVTRAAGGSFVSNEVPEQRARRYAKHAPDAARRHVRVSTSKHGLWSTPVSLIRRPWLCSRVCLICANFLRRSWRAPTRRALRGAGRANLDYSSPFGEPRLRAALARMVSVTRGLSVRLEQLLVTHGSQMALDLVARTLVLPGDRVGVEQIGLSARLGGARTSRC